MSNQENLKDSVKLFVENACHCGMLGFEPGDTEEFFDGELRELPVDSVAWKRPVSTKIRLVQSTNRQRGCKTIVSIPYRGEYRATLLFGGYPPDEYLEYLTAGIERHDAQSTDYSYNTYESQYYIQHGDYITAAVYAQREETRVEALRRLWESTTDSREAAERLEKVYAEEALPPQYEYRRHRLEGCYTAAMSSSIREDIRRLEAFNVLSKLDRLKGPYVDLLVDGWVHLAVRGADAASRREAINRLFALLWAESPCAEVLWRRFISWAPGGQVASWQAWMYSDGNSIQ